jgi:hypothetical protein
MRATAPVGLEIAAREAHTTCTAVAPEAVFAVQTYGTGTLYNPD